MKINFNLKMAGTVLVASMLTATVNAQEIIDIGEPAPTVLAAANCITREDQLYSAPRIEALVNKVGGMRNLEGQWKLGGVEGNFKRVIINFDSKADGMRALIEGLDSVDSVWAALTVCETNRDDVVHVKVHGQDDSLFMRGVSKSAIQIAQITNGKAGSFYTFNKR